ncbi:uncharacterized protein LOC78625 isoform X1 [Mus musculus]|uniref:uncharacterized protein LOC78625 isoform X1 n=1 Tax=Mus musculus TaxID=10090 RepID=UPI0003D76765|nr:uncharacterized protein LOC78625 isoform X1 [Mus musculus]|eukprot:XP_006525204.1 PREDICTED: uncharacterized protein LOC78625 isoform X1 [Mus musculus]
MTDPKESDNLQTSRRILKTKTILKNKIHSAISKKAQADNFEILTPGSSYWTSKREGQVQLRMGKDPLDNEPPVTVPDLIMSAATKYSHYLAIGSKYKKSWQLLTYIEYYEACRRAAKAFLKVGLERFHGVGIMGINSSEWVIASIGAIMAGGISVGILSSISPKACQVIAETSEMDIFVVDNDRQLQKINQIQGYLKHLKAIIQYREDIQEAQPNLYSWKGFLDLADGISDEKLDKIIDTLKPNQCCALVYNQGTTGPSKAIMLSHDNITWTTAAIVQSLGFKCPPQGQEILVSYLPLCFPGIQILDVWVAISVAGTVYFPSLDSGKWSGLPRTPGTRPIPSHSGLPDGAAPRGPAHHVLRHSVGVGPHAGQSEDQIPGLHRLPQEDRPLGHAHGPPHQQEADDGGDPPAAVLRPGQEIDLRARQEVPGSQPLPAVSKHGHGAAEWHAGFLPQRKHPYHGVVRLVGVHGTTHSVQPAGLPDTEI